MENSINQLYTLFVFILSGAVIGILFDLFRILRKSFKTPDIITYIEDILFWILTGLFLLYIIFKYSFGQLRIYMFVSLIIGIVIYFLTISKYFIKLNVKTIRIYKIYYIKNFIRSILPYKNNI
ncbi:spore cortex biosynthesis protein YabQ [Clostridium sp. CAG:571]|jgi:spore cortex biosynthesis protein YabQ|nr:spore cortex biosynthesis protein YabQ [Clostridium sp. CAG:571]